MHVYIGVCVCVCVSMYVCVYVQFPAYEHVRKYEEKRVANCVT